MTNQPNKQAGRGVLLGLALIAVLLAVTVGGALCVHNAAKNARLAAQQASQMAQQEQTPLQEISQPDVQPPCTELQTVIELPPEPSVVTLMALGDNLIHNCIYWSAELPEGGYDFLPFYADIRPVAEQYDLACINQETIYVSDAVNYGNYPYFGTPTQVGDALVHSGFDVVCHATNHSYDKQDTGILDTIAFWRQSYPEVTVLGIHDSQEDADTIRIVEKNGIRIAMLNYTYGLNYGNPPQRHTVDLLDDTASVAQDIAQAKAQSDFVLVFVHWGEEGTHVPTEKQRSWAQFFADEGVDLVIGAHPHVLQPLETVTAKDGREMPVFYSLGNFLSHQVDAVNMLGGMASVTIEKDDSGVRLTSCELLPTINVIIHRDWAGNFDYRPMLLRDYTEELAQKHRIPGTGVEQMWTLFRQVTGQ